MPQGTISIEPEAGVKESACAACAGTNRLSHGFVYDDGEPHGVYVLEWCDGDHPFRAAFLTVSLGPYGDNTDAGGRRSFCIEWRSDGMSLADEPARDRPDFLGAFVSRDAALALPWIDDVWHVADHVVLDDPRSAAVARWLESGQADP